MHTTSLHAPTLSGEVELFAAQNDAEISLSPLCVRCMQARKSVSAADVKKYERFQQSMKAQKG